MELWIRSQDKECLMKVDRLDYDLQNNEHRIVVNGYQKLVAQYETKERALEVLEDIQDTLIAKYVTSLNSKAAMLETEEETTKVLKKMAVYEMPKE